MHEMFSQSFNGPFLLLSVSLDDKYIYYRGGGWLQDDRNEHVMSGQSPINLPLAELSIDSRVESHRDRVSDGILFVH